MNSEAPRGTLALTEPHPCALLALEWIRSQPGLENQRWLESFYSTAMSGNRLAEVCAETLRRLLSGEMVSDRYIMGLYIAMRYDHAEIKGRTKNVRPKGKEKGSKKREGVEVPPA